MFKRVLLLILCFCFGLSISIDIAQEALFTVSADTTSTEDKAELEALKNKLNGIQSDINRVEEENQATSSDTQSMLEEKLFLEQTYTLLKQEEDTINGIISGYETIIETAKKNKQDKETELIEQLDDFSTILVYMCKYGDTSRLELFLSSDSYSDYLSRIESMEHILNSGDKMISDINNTISAIEKEQAEYEEAHKAMNDYMADLKNTQAEILAKGEDLEKHIKENLWMLDLTDKELQDMQGDIDKLLEEIAELEKVIAEKEQQEKEEQEKLESQQPNDTQPGNPNIYNGTFSFPLYNCTSYYITSRFGVRTDGPFVDYEHHNGLDLACARGTPICAVADGTVIYSGFRGAFGNVLFISHGNGLTTIYAHCDTLLVDANTKVLKDQIVAKVGSTGQSSGYHLHFAVMKNGVYVNPEPYIFGD